MSIEQIYMFDNNIFAFLLLSILLFVVIVKKDIYDHSRKLFYRMIIMNMILLLVEVFAWAFDGIDTQAAIIANYAFNCLLIIFEPLMAAMWLSYVDFKINGSIERIKNRIYYIHAAIFAVILLIINIFTPVAFYLDDNNVYHRGSWLWLSLIFVFGMVLYTVVLAISSRSKISKNMLLFISMFAFLPLMVSFIQLLVYGLILTWAVVALGIVFAYYLIEIAGNSEDYLTKLYSRKKIEEIIRGKIETKKTLSLIMIDLEYFKEINDTYGHKTGDDLLVHFSKVLRITFGNKAYISRIGGDEFLIVSDVDTQENLLEFRSKLQTCMDEYTQFPQLKEIRFSFGAEVFDYSYDLSLDFALKTIDELMYLNKAKNKNEKRRRTD